MFAKEGVTRYDPVNQPFDPNLHNALFEVPDATKEPSTVAVVVKVRGRRCWRNRAGGAGACGGRCPAAGVRRDRQAASTLSCLAHPCRDTPSCLQRGYMLNDRVVRAADVGVTRAMEE